MILTIETNDMKITLSVTPGGVTIDAPAVMGQATRQTTLSEAQWRAYAEGRKDQPGDFPTFAELEEISGEECECGIGRYAGCKVCNALAEEGCHICDSPDTGGSNLCDQCFDDMNGVEGRDYWVRPDGEVTDMPPKVDPISGNISDSVKAYRKHRNGRAQEQQPREVCYSSCCGTAGARTRDGSCKGCR